MIEIQLYMVIKVIEKIKIKKDKVLAVEVDK